jgi:ABC-type transport system involved in multi-copper enzyme maturation permease subunit
MFGDLLDTGRLLRLSARSLSGRLYLAAPLLPLAWPAFLVFQLLIGGREEDYAAHEAQAVIAVPLAVLGILLGVSIIAGEIDRRTLEIAYTVPGGTHRVWLAKFAAGCLTLVAGEMLLAIVVYAFLTSFPPGALYGALQAAVFYLALGMGLAALFKSWVSGALVSVSVLVLNGVFTGFGSVQLRLSPFWNPFVPQFAEFDEVDILSWTVQNRIGFVLATAAVVALAIQRAEQREKLL